MFSKAISKISKQLIIVLVCSFIGYGYYAMPLFFAKG